MNESDDELQQLAGEYVLGTLSAAQRKEVEQRLSREEALRSAVEQWEQRLMPLSAIPVSYTHLTLPTTPYV